MLLMDCALRASPDFRQEQVGNHHQVDTTSCLLLESCLSRDGKRELKAATSCAQCDDFLFTGPQAPTRSSKAASCILLHDVDEWYRASGHPMLRRNHAAQTACR